MNYRSGGFPPLSGQTGRAVPAPASRATAATVFGLLTFSFLFAIVGGFVGLQVFSRIPFGIVFFIGLAISQIVLILALRPIAVRSAPLGLAALYSFTFLSGLAMAPIILSYASAGLLSLVAQALVLTAILTIGLTAFALTTDISLARIGTWLFIGLIALIGASVLFIFFRSPVLNVLIGAGGAILFSLFLVYDVQRVRDNQNDFAGAVVIAAAIFLDISNLFLSILRLLGIFGGSNRE